MSRGSVALVGFVLAASVLSIGCVVQSCPTASLSGQLVEVDGSLAVKTADGEQVAVDWSNYSVRRIDDKLVVTNFWGTRFATEGQSVDLGGGFVSDDGRFMVCGQIDVVQSK